MMLIEKLSSNDIRLIDDYRKNYAFSSEANDITHTFMDVPFILREWNAQKSEYLYKLLGEKLTISKHLNYNKSYEQLQEEIADFTNRRYGRAARSGEEFCREYFDWLFPAYNKPHHNFPEEVVNGLQRLMSDDCLIYNKYDEAGFDLMLPDGHKLRVSNGCKTSKMLGKIANAFNLKGYEDFRICHSQVLNQKNLGGTLTLSIHPLDYMTMSDNDMGWESCMSWRNEGGYRQGTVEMMNSPVVLVAYLASDEKMNMWPVTGSRNEENDVWNDKKWRQLFLINEDILISVKDYPYHNSDLSKMVTEWIRELATENLGWTYNSPIEYSYSATKIHLDTLPDDKNNFALDIMSGAMYNDFGALDFHWLCVNSNIDHRRIKTYSYRNTPYLHVKYSGKSECMICGELNPDLEDESCLACHECQDRVRCDCCGDIIHGESAYVDGMTMCEYCYDNRTHECAHCGTNHCDDMMTPIYVIPRLTETEQNDLIEAYKTNHPFDYEYTLKEGYDDFNYFQERTDIWLCDHDDCFDTWIKENLKEGCKPHRRQLRWTTDWYVYFDELTEDAMDTYCWGYDNNPELYKTRFVPRHAYPSKFITDNNSDEDELPF